MSADIHLARIEQALHDAHQRFATLEEGENAQYIPALAEVDSELFALAAVTVEGEILSVGDSEELFAIESISKAFNLSLAMDLHGAATLRQKVGAESTGEAFNSVIALELHQGKPLNPLVNAGAMATVSLITGDHAEDRWEKMQTRFDEMAGGSLPVLKDVYESESETNQHNKGIAWLLQSYGYLYSDVESSVDLYTRLCSLGVSTRQLAVMGACYATGGIHPLSKQRVVQAENVHEILADMVMEGLYTGSGSWLYEAGLPAKSGVGGGIVCVVPGKMALAAFSPKLDKDGNSVRARQALIHIIELLELNPFRIYSEV